MGCLLSFLCISGKIDAVFSTPYINFFASEEPGMYRNVNDGHVNSYDFILFFGGHLK